MKTKLFLTTAIATALITTLVFDLPARADVGFITGSSPDVIVNVRQYPTTNANRVGEARVGDRVETLDSVEAGDGFRWYQVRLFSTGQTGWVRGDLICFQNCPVNPDSSNPSNPNTAFQIISQIRGDRLPQAESVLRQNSYSQIGSSQADGQYVVKRYQNPQNRTIIRVEYLNGLVANASVENQGQTPAPNQTVVDFATRTYAVRVFRRNGQLQMNVYNNRANQLVVNAQPVQQSSASSGTRYVASSGDLIYEVQTNGNSRALVIRRGGAVLAEEGATR
ncbi:MAG: SH3 domain-containing protein [Elainellaceae cyanobacterium]